MKTFHNQLREKYSSILWNEINNNLVLADLSEDDREELFNVLSNWFGTSPPEHKRVKNQLRDIITKKIKSDTIKLERD